ncbi:MAG: UDP-3-O-(3-hydroxymyristoyl)glucosamine N-acyltransferase [Methylotetracoccus sp.]
MNIRTSELFDRFHEQGLLLRRLGPDVQVTGIAPVEECGPGDLVFVDHAKFLAKLTVNGPAAVVTSEDIALQLPDDTQISVLVASNVRFAIALIKQAYADRDVRDSGWPRIHPGAIIHPSAVVPDSVTVGPGAVIGPDVRLGERAVVMANVVLEQGVSIGAGTVLHPGCVVCYDCEVGSDSILKPGCVIGSEGFGFAQDDQRHNHRIPQTGRVVIGNRVVIGANTTIDRATYGATMVHDGAVIDALCHLGHNVEIGEDCILCAHTGISGSSRFGKRVIATGQTGVLNHVSVADDSVLLHRAGVNNSIKQPGMYAGGPTQPLQQYLKNMAVFPRLHEIFTRLKQLERTVAERLKPIDG